MVLLDLVMNHFGPFGNYLPSYAPQFYTDTPTPWGDGIDFHRPEVRAFFLESALGWIEDYRLDGFRLDAVQPRRAREEIAADTRAARTVKQVRRSRQPGVCMYMDILDRYIARKR